MPRPTIYIHPRCSTCRKALKWLATELGEVELDVRDLLEAPPTADELRDLVARSGLPLRRFFNTSGQSWREGGFRDRIDELSEEQALAELAADPMLVKRPVFDAGVRVVTGFREAEWRDALDAARSA